MNPYMDRIIDWLFRPYSCETVAKLPFDLKLVIPPNCKVARNLIAGIYEKELTSVFTKLIKKGMNIVDIGAHIGYYTLLASRLVGPNGKVFAFEPDPVNLIYLKTNISINNCSNVIITSKAVFRKNGEAYLLIQPDHSTNYLSRFPKDKEGAFKVPTVTLDVFFGMLGWPRVDLIKADVEGSEVAVLEGMTELSRRNPHLCIILECNPKALKRAGYSTDSLITSLKNLGYNKGYIIERSLQPFDLRKGFPYLLTKGSTAYNLLLIKRLIGKT